MKRNVDFFDKGLFNNKIMDSKVNTQSMNWKEKILGYLIGPFGTLAFMAVINQLVELYYTEVFYVDNIYGVGTYLVMSWITKSAAVVVGLLAGYIIEHSHSRQGKIRPMVLIGSIILTISGFFMFFIPNMSDSLKLVWIYVFNIGYNGVGVTLFNLRSNLLTLCTRNQDDRNQMSLFDKMSSFLLVGTFVSLIIGSILYYTMLHGYPQRNWILLVLAFAIISIPLSIVEYFYTKERVTLENYKAKGEDEEHHKDDSVGVWAQFKSLFKSKYWVLAFLLTIIMYMANNLQGYNLNTNFCTVVLGATAENNYNLIYTVASGIPMGLGILLVYPIAKKITIRKTTIFFGMFSILGCVLGLIFQTNFWLVVIANFIFNFGTLPVIYILYALIYSTNDEVEYKFNFRPEGTIALTITTCIVTIFSGVFSGVYETGLSMNGYDAALGTMQPEGVINWLYFARYIIPLIEYVLIIVILIFLNLEKKLPDMQKAILLRHKEETEARGEVWVSLEELEAKEKEANRLASEEARIDDLKALCLKKGLDFDTENNKYLAKKQMKLDKKNKKDKNE